MSHSLKSLLFALLLVCSLIIFCETSYALSPEEPVSSETPACSETGEHVYAYTDNGDGTHRAVCSLCGADLQEPCDYGTPEVYTPTGEGSHAKTCILCGGSVMQPCCYEDEAVIPTQTTPGGLRHTCNVCGYAYLENETPPESQRAESRRTGDVDGDGEVTSADARALLRAVLSLESISADLLPYADINADGKLTSEDARAALRIAVGLDHVVDRHAFTVNVIKKPTCMDPGELEYSCDYCKIGGSLVMPPLGHSYGAATVKPATCSATGLKTQTCSRCGFVNNITLSRKEHTWSANKYASEISCTACGARPNGWFQLNGDWYYCDNGVKRHSWCSIGGDNYFFDRDTGVMAYNTRVDGIRLYGDGTAADDDYSAEKVRTLITAKNIVARITDPDDSIETKKLKCFYWVMDFPYRQYRYVGASMQYEGFEMLFANDIFERGAGCCGSTSYAFAFLAVECGCEDVYVCDDGVSDSGHAWVVMEGSYNVYDVIFAEAKSFSGNYNAAVSDYRAYPPRMTYVGG